MKTLLILVGKTADRLYSEGISDYAGRIAHYMPFDIKVVPEPRNTRSMGEAQQKEREGELILAQVQPADTVVLLDERGTERRSVEFAAWLAVRQQSARRLVFVIGGPYGFSPAVYARAQEMVSLTRMTLSHQMVRLVFLEQLYRACTINRGEKYHHE